MFSFQMPRNYNPLVVTKSLHRQFSQLAFRTRKPDWVFVSGLTLTLFVNQDEYIGDLSSDAGVRIAVHRADQFPFVEDQGFNVGVGQKKSIRIRAVSWRET